MQQQQQQQRGERSQHIRGEKYKFSPTQVDNRIPRSPRSENATAHTFILRNSPAGRTLSRNERSTQHTQQHNTHDHRHLVVVLLCENVRAFVACALGADRARMWIQPYNHLFVE